VFLRHSLADGLESFGSPRALCGLHHWRSSVAWFTDRGQGGETVLAWQAASRDGLSAQPAKSSRLWLLGSSTAAQSVRAGGWKHSTCDGCRARVALVCGLGRRGVIWWHEWSHNPEVPAEPRRWGWLRQQSKESRSFALSVSCLCSLVGSSSPPVQ